MRPCCVEWGKGPDFGGSDYTVLCENFKSASGLRMNRALRQPPDARFRHGNPTRSLAHARPAGPYVLPRFHQWRPLTKARKPAMVSALRGAEPLLAQRPHDHSRAAFGWTNARHGSARRQCQGAIGTAGRTCHADPARSMGCMLPAISRAPKTRRK
ncbi:hypothetical protein Pden_3855 [Paracoccus denitrificans PD1222]|uniref:Uncharacterized protein n=1 Tax=Paracoccus denitrificans (strain Pd 1222) TaxID=318586 RepID=A1B8S7_PARDP|nr:hypothetical protein Pden_3855 [Paracoccus denitrificans PD1222]